MRRLRDVIVVGAGPGGSAAAAALARTGLDVLLLDKAEFPRDKTCGDALSPGGVTLLRAFGLGEVLEKEALRIDGVALTAPAGRTVTAAIPPHPEHPSYGYVVPRMLLDDRIRQAAMRLGAEFHGSFHARAMHLQNGGIQVSGESSGRTVEHQARLAIVATGASLPFLTAAGLAPRKVHYAHAARAYYEGLRGLEPRLQIRFDGVALPGYAWIFPLSETSANVGAGFYRRTRRTPPTAAAMLRGFLESPGARPLFAGATAAAPIKGFPLRTDFDRSPTVGPRALLVGEAAGLVNPFTGEGIDYALESGRMAAQAAQACFEEGDFSHASLSRYDRALRARFQRAFVLTHRLRSLYMNHVLLDPFLRACERWPELTRLLVEVMLTYQDAATLLRPKVLLRVLQSLAPRSP
jgi:geranylgeranyl reductase family protein